MITGVIHARGLSRTFRKKRGKQSAEVRAVAGVDLDVEHRRTDLHLPARPGQMTNQPARGAVARQQDGGRSLVARRSPSSTSPSAADARRIGQMGSSAPVRAAAG